MSALGWHELKNSVLKAELSDAIRAEIPGRLIEDEPMSRHTSWRVGGPAAFYCYPESNDAASSLIKLCSDRNIEYFVIGFGTNLLVSDDGFAGCIIDLSNACSRFRIQDNAVTVGAAVWLHDAVRQAASNGLQGWEKLAGIPGGLGGGLSMNCGAFGASISGHLIEIEALNEIGDPVKLSRKEIGFEYRRAPGLVGKTMLEAVFKLPAAPAEDIIRETEATITERFRRNVMNLPSAGSVFKNPKQNHAAKLLDAAGVKGMSTGGAEFSMLHANFIVNARGGSASDIVDLMKRAWMKVKEAHGISLELEVRILGMDAGLALK